jgi:glycolate oxidase FAD binding subunit
VTQEAASRGGAAVVERAPLDVKRQLDVWGPTGGDFGLMQSLKREFDPKRTLNPGRFVGGI